MRYNNSGRQCQPTLFLQQYQLQWDQYSIPLCFPISSLSCCVLVSPFSIIQLFLSRFRNKLLTCCSMIHVHSTINFLEFGKIFIIPMNILTQKTVTVETNYDWGCQPSKVCVCLFVFVSKRWASVMWMFSNFSFFSSPGGSLCRLGNRWVVNPSGGLESKGIDCMFSLIVRQVECGRSLQSSCRNVQTPQLLTVVRLVK